MNFPALILDYKRTHFHQYQKYVKSQIPYTDIQNHTIKVNYVDNNWKINVDKVRCSSLFISVDSVSNMSSTQFVDKVLSVINSTMIQLYLIMNPFVFKV